MTTPEIIYALKTLQQRVRDLEDLLRTHTHKMPDHPSYTLPADLDSLEN